MKALTIILMSALGARAATGAPIADSLADSLADFSDTQAQGGWTYGYFNISQGDTPLNPASFRELEWIGSLNGWFRAGNADWTWIGHGALAPHLPGAGKNNPDEQWAVLRWTSDRAGVLNITGVVDEFDAGGDGTEAFIFVDGVEKAHWILPGEANPEIPYDINVLAGLGSTIDFVVSPRETIFFDSTWFTAVIVPACPPVIVVSASAFGLAIRRRR